MTKSFKDFPSKKEYDAYVHERARIEIEARREACSKYTGLTIVQIKKMQEEGWTIKEITAGKAHVNKNGMLISYEPKLLIYSGPDY